MIGWRGWTSTQYTVNIVPAVEGGFWAEVPALPGCFTKGETLEEVTARLRETIECHLARLALGRMPVTRREAGPEDVRVPGHRPHASPRLNPTPV